MRTESRRWIPAPGSVNRPEVFVRSMRASATSVRFVIQEKTAQTAIRILNGFQRARSQTRWKNTANRIKDGRIQKSLAIPKSTQTRPPAKAQRIESGIPVRKIFSGFVGAGPEPEESREPHRAPWKKTPENTA